MADNIGSEAAFLILSPEPLLLSESEKEMMDRIVPEEARDLNTLAVYGWEADVRSVLEFLQTMPFLSDRRMLVLREVHAFEQWRDLIDYLKDPNPGSFLLMTSSELKKTDAQYKSLSKHARVKELRRLYGNSLVRWVVDRFRKLEKGIDRDLARLLVETTGSSLTALAAEVEKVSLHAGEREDIEKEDLGVSIPGGIENIFNLLDALGDGDLQTAMICLRRLLESGSRPEHLIPMIARHYRQMIRGRSLISKGMTPGKAAAQLGIRYPNFQQKFARHLRRAERRDLESDLHRLSVSDRLIKTGRVPADIVLDRLLVELLV